MSIRVENLAKSFGHVKALRQIQIDVAHGELFGLIGPDGAGKTTLMRIITTLLLPDQGNVWVNELHAVRDYKAIRKITGYMPGKFSLYPDLSVEENINFYASVFDQKFDENLDTIRDIYIQLAPFKTRRAGKLSGGMKQKLALCCALIHKPQVLILDEPTTGVDAVSRNEFWNMLSSIKKQGITILVSTPYMDEAVRCDRIALIQDGIILQTDTPTGITAGFEKPLYSVRTADLYGALNDLKKGEKAYSAYLFGGQSIHLIPSSETGSDQLHGFLKDAGHTQIEIAPIGPGVEDCFMQLMTQHGNPA
jgi:ABC-2 type transport system ATP-binding protein